MDRLGSGSACGPWRKESPRNRGARSYRVGRGDADGSAGDPGLARPTRRRILELLRKRDMTAGELADHFDLAKPTLSGHFAVLKEADLIQADKVATTITYRLNVSVLEEALLALMTSFKLGKGVQK